MEIYSKILKSLFPSMEFSKFEHKMAEKVGSGRYNVFLKLFLIVSEYHIHVDTLKCNSEKQRHEFIKLHFYYNKSIEHWMSKNSRYFGTNFWEIIEYLFSWQWVETWNLGHLYKKFQELKPAWSCRSTPQYEKNCKTNLFLDRSRGSERWSYNEKLDVSSWRINFQSKLLRKVRKTCNSPLMIFESMVTGHLLARIFSPQVYSVKIGDPFCS